MLHNIMLLVLGLSVDGFYAEYILSNNLKPVTSLGCSTLPSHQPCPSGSSSTSDRCQKRLSLDGRTYHH